MAITDKNIIKSWFETGDYPTQEQFWNVWDSYWHKNELNIDNILRQGGNSFGDNVNLEIGCIDWGNVIFLKQGYGIFEITDYNFWHTIHDGPHMTDMGIISMLQTQSYF